MGWLEQLFDTSDFPPRWQCGNWSEAFGWTYIGADLLIASAYLAIPISIAVYYLRRREELYFPSLYWLLPRSSSCVGWATWWMPRCSGGPGIGLPG